MNMRNGAPSLFKSIPGAQKMGGNAGPGGTNWEAVEAVFKTATEDMGLDWGDEPTTDEASRLRKVALAHGLKLRAMHLKAWFDNWYLFYPFVDDIAVERAINFDMYVWPALTARRRHQVLVRLSVDPDAPLAVHPDRGAQSPRKRRRRGPEEGRVSSDSLFKPDLEKTLEHYGVYVPTYGAGWVKILCPRFDQDESRPSATVNFDAG